MDLIKISLNFFYILIEWGVVFKKIYFDFHNYLCAYIAFRDGGDIKLD